MKQTETISEERILAFMDLVRLRHEETQFHRLPMEKEDALVEKIKSGNYDAIHIPPFSEMKDHFGLLAMKPEKTYEYYAAASIASYARLVMTCGVEADDALDLSDTLLFILCDLKTEEEIHDLFQKAAVLFAKQVYYANHEPGKYLVRKIQNYVRQNLFHQLSIQEISEYIRRTPNYLSSLFVKETGMTIHQYIQRERIATAKNLLAQTSRPIGEIAIYLGFESPSNFAVVFRKLEHMTPTEYRNRMFKEVY